VFSIGFLATLPAVTALADPLPIPIKPIKPIKLDLIETVNVTQNVIYGSAEVAPDVNFKAGKGCALSSFSLSFRNGDHKFNAAGVEPRMTAPDSGVGRLTFHDQNTDDPFTGSAKWYQSPQFSSAWVEAQGSGEFDIPISTRPGYTPVLAGFVIKRADGSDANIRTFGIRLLPNKRGFRVTLLDDQGLDMGRLAALVGGNFAMTTGDPSLMIGGMVSIGAGLSGRFPDIDPTTHLRRYKIDLGYTFVADRVVATTGKLSGSSVRYESGRRPRSGERLAIQGFLLHFNNSDHHILKIGVNPENAVSDQPCIQWQDGNGRDPLQWQMDYVVLK